MKVWVLMQHDWDDDWIEGVFASRPLAVAAQEAHEHGIHCTVDEWEVQGA